MFGATLKVNANWEHEKEIFFQCIMAKPEIATLLELQVVLSQNQSFFPQLPKPKLHNKLLLRFIEYDCSGFWKSIYFTFYF